MHYAKEFPTMSITQYINTLENPKINAKYLQNDHSKENSAGDAHVPSDQHKGTAAELTGQVQEDKESGKKAAAPPGGVHVIPLLIPLHPHPYSIFEERTDQAQTCNVRKNVLSMTQCLYNKCK